MTIFSIAELELFNVWAEDENWLDFSLSKSAFPAVSESKISVGRVMPLLQAASYPDKINELIQ